MTKLLVCEGRCNGGMVQKFDEAVRLTGPRVSGARNRNSVISQEWLDTAKTFMHTAHKYVGPDRYACVTCGTVRKY